jgi:DnaK suppressor protein
MSSNNRSLFRRLTREDREVRRRIASLRHQRYSQASAPDGPGEGAIDSLNQALAASLHQHEEVVWMRLAARSQAVAEARQRVREGRYGFCRVCGCRIPPRRLAAMPTATLCVSCQERQEAGRIAV